MLMVRKQPAATFTVALTNYGWSVQLDGEHLELFQTQQQALAEVKRRRVELMAKGKSTSVVVVGSQLADAARTHSSRSSWTISTSRKK